MARAWAPKLTRTLAAAFAAAHLASAAQPRDPAAIDKTPWGVAVGHDSAWSARHWAPQIAAAGVHTVRGFADYPETFAVLEKYGFKASGILQWSPKGKKASFPVDDLPGWNRYVQDIVSRYKGRVQQWEVWNEPPNFTADTSPASYAKLVQAAYKTAKATAPDVQIGLAAKSSHVKWLAETIDAGAAGHYDYITLHPYESAAYVQGGWERQFLGIVPTVRRMLAEKDPARANVPIDFTEIGIPTNWSKRRFPEAVPEPLQAELLVKFYALSLAQGVRRVSWFEAWDGDAPDPATSGAPFGLIRRDGHKRPAYTALKSLVGTLGQAPRYLGATDFGGAGHGFYFESERGGGATVLVAWAHPGGRVPLDFAEPVRVVKPGEGVEKEAPTQFLQLTNAPLILSARPGAIATAWRREAAQPPATPRAPAQSMQKAQPVQAKASGATATADATASPPSVSLVAGRPDQGLRWPGKPAPVRVNGVQAYPVSGRSRALFAVDPAFLAWDAQRITVTAVLHKLDGGDAGFNLKYESTAPLSAGDGNGLTPARGCWCKVADGGPVTRSWVIDNPRFVGMFGYHFALDSDSAKNSHYAIESITVTKTP